jgi:hypothetical protein
MGERPSGLAVASALHALLAAQPDGWQMGLGERLAIVGLLAELRPRLAVEIGTAEGGSLRRIAAWSDEVHAFDVTEPPEALRELPNVVFHVGDSPEQLPRVLAGLDERGERVDFALVDGDHTADGVEADMRALLASPAMGRAVIAVHDTMNEEVRAGLERIDFDGEQAVRYVELDCVAGFLFREPLEGELWGGLGVVVLHDEWPRHPGAPASSGRYHSTHELLLRARERA